MGKWYKIKTNRLFSCPPGCLFTNMWLQIGFSSTHYCMYVAVRVPDRNLAEMWQQHVARWMNKGTCIADARVMLA